MPSGEKDSIAILLAAIIIAGAFAFAYFNSLINTFTLLMMLYGCVALLGGIAHRLTGEWGAINLGIGVFGVILLFTWISIDLMVAAQAITLTTAELLKSFWQGFTFLITLGIIYIIGEFQIFG